MPSNGTLLLTRQDVIALLSLEESMTAVENAFALYADGKVMPPAILGMHSVHGGFHIKAGIMNAGKNYFAAKINSNFTGNRDRYGLPLIQGIIVVCDADNGQLLALIDSIEITIVRTGAASAIAAKYLSRENAKTITICGCGNQGRISLRALAKIRKLKTAYAFDIDKKQADGFAKELSKELKINVTAIDNLERATIQSDICVTCTSSKTPFLQRESIQAGSFIAAVGADSEDKQEIFPGLMASAKIVVDILEQCERIGELHHAIESGLIRRMDVHAELGEIITGKKAIPAKEKEIIIFDSTGMALQDVAVAAMVYEKALKKGIGMKLSFNEAAGNHLAQMKNRKAIAALSGFFPFR